ncbi:MAG: hypothetical protein ACK4WJ_06200 [Endomicrobiia bacterium]
MKDIIQIATELVKYQKTINALEEKVKQLKELLIQNTKPGTIIKVNGNEVEHKLVKETITDIEMLRQIGIDPQKVTVTITKIDPLLVRRIGVMENKKYYIEKSNIFIKNLKKI